MCFFYYLYIVESQAQAYSHIYSPCTCASCFATQLHYIFFFPCLSFLIDACSVLNVDSHHFSPHLQISVHPSKCWDDPKNNKINALIYFLLGCDFDISISLSKINELN